MRIRLHSGWHFEREKVGAHGKRRLLGALRSKQLELDKWVDSSQRPQDPWSEGIFLSVEVRIEFALSHQNPAREEL
jgi:hypothetical protein